MWNVILCLNITVVCIPFNEYLDAGRFWYNFLCKKISCSVRTPNKRARSDVNESHGFCNFTKYFKLFWMNIFVNWKMTSSWLKVLSHGQDIHSNRSEITHCLYYFVFTLSET